MDQKLDLLCGMLALQADLLTNDQFSETCSAWVTRESRPLAHLVAAVADCELRAKLLSLGLAESIRSAPAVTLGATDAGATRTPGRDSHSVPPEYVGRRVWARWDGQVVRVYNQRFEQIALRVQQEPQPVFRENGREPRLA